MLGKKGDHELMMNIFDLIILAIITLILLGFISSISTGNIMVKEYISKDLALVIDALYISPYDAPYVYDGAISPINDYNFEFTEGKVIIYENKTEKGIPLKIWHPFAVDNNVKLHQTPQFAPDYIEIYKRPYDFYIGVEPEQDTVSKCLGIETKDIAWERLNFAIDPGHGGDDYGYDQEVRESEYTRKLGLEISEYFKTKGLSTTSTRSLKLDEATSFSERITKIPKDSLIISLHIGFDNNKYYSPITIYADRSKFEKNSKFTCILRNKIISELKDFNEINIEFLDLSLIPKEDPRRILSASDNIGVFIELGNALYPKDTGLLSNQNYGIISRIIYESISEYYE